MEWERLSIAEHYFLKRKSGIFLVLRFGVLQLCCTLVYLKMERIREQAAFVLSFGISE